jgi:hypothetical protein
MHRFVPVDSPSSAPSIAASETAALKRWTSDFLKLGPDAVISVLNTSCVDPGCPVIETTVLVQTPGTAARAWRFQRPRVAVNRVTLEQVLATPGFVPPARTPTESRETGLVPEENALPPQSST